jgi:uncharacterized membrane protein YbhN (UPF0104 family)
MSTSVTPHAQAVSSRRARTSLLWTAKILVSVVLLWVLLSRVDGRQLWGLAQAASPAWLAAALAIYLVMVLISAWRWQILLDAQHVRVGFGRLTQSFLVATFFNNFLPSNIGGDVIRIRDTARPAGSKTLATTIVLLDRGIGLLGLLFVAAAGATLITGRQSSAAGPVGAGTLWGVLALGVIGTAPLLLMPHRLVPLLRPLERLHRDWVSRQIAHLTTALAKFGAAPGTLFRGFVGAVAVQLTIVLFYAAAARALTIPIPLAHLAVLIPLSFIVQMAPISVNGFGVREATFTVYFSRIGLPIESAMALSLVGAALLMVFSISGAIIHAGRRHDGHQRAA